MKSKSISFVLNNALINPDVNPSFPLLDFIRKEKHLTGTKEVCKEGDCGACTVLLGELTGNEIKYKTITSCIYPTGNCHGKHIVTIEGINKAELLLHQQAMVDEHASQCGFCTPGFVMSLTCYLLNNDKYKIEDAVNSIAGNICRCTGYHSIIRSMQNVIDEVGNAGKSNLLSHLVNKNVIPEYFENVKDQLKKIKAEDVPRNGKSNIFIGGGSDLFVQKPDDLLETDVTLLAQQKLNYVTKNKDGIEIGGGTTFEEIKQSDVLLKVMPALKRDIDLIASLPVRNAATVGGNLSNASPIGDITIILLALNSMLVLSDGRNERELPLGEYYLGYKKLNKEPYEFIKSVSFSTPKKNFHFSFEKVSKRTYLDIASVNTASAIETNGSGIKNISISAGGIAPVPKLLNETNEFLHGKQITIETIEQALTVTQNEISPISDVRGSAEYKRLLLNQLIKAHFVKLFPELISEAELV